MEDQGQNMVSDIRHFVGHNLMPEGFVTFYILHIAYKAQKTRLSTCTIIDEIQLINTDNKYRMYLNVN